MLLTRRWSRQMHRSRQPFTHAREAPSRQPHQLKSSFPCRRICQTERRANTSDWCFAQAASTFAQSHRGPLRGGAGIFDAPTSAKSPDSRLERVHGPLFFCLSSFMRVLPHRAGPLISSILPKACMSSCYLTYAKNAQKWPTEGDCENEST